MKSNVRLSTYSVIVTIVCFALIVFVLISAWGQEKSYIGIAVFTAVVISGLFYFPRSIEASDNQLIIHRQLKDKSLAYSEILSVDRCFPSYGGLRISGSAGFFGYWGYFSDIVIGSYFGYYGNLNQCILIKLKNGKQYVISCNEPDEMVEFINRKIYG